MAKGKKKDNDGYLRVLVSSKDENGYYFAASTREKGVVARLDGEFYLNVPVTPEAQAEAMAGASTTFEVAPGEKVRVKGPQAPAARKYYSDALEPERGVLRDKALEGTILTADVFQGMLDAAQPYTGRGGRRTPEVSQEEIEKLSGDELTAYLVARGVKVA